MDDDLNLRSKEFWNRMIWGLLLGLLSALGAYIFIFLMDLGQGLFWPGLTEWTPFSGPWWMIIVMTGIGFIVGLINHYTSARQITITRHTFTAALRSHDMAFISERSVGNAGCSICPFIRDHDQSYQQSGCTAEL